MDTELARNPEVQGSSAERRPSNRPPPRNPLSEPVWKFAPLGPSTLNSAVSHHEESSRNHFDYLSLVFAPFYDGDL